jgi:hypothetical protein
MMLERERATHEATQHAGETTTTSDIASLNAADARLWTRYACIGDFERAWAVSDRIRERTRRFQDPRTPRHLQQVWDGTPLADRRVLVRCYHGLGDTIQFIRYAPLVKRIARHVAVWAPPRLLPLLATTAGIDSLLPLHDGTPEISYDVDVEIMELPYVCRTTLGTIPNHVPYLSVDPLSVPWQGKTRVGIVWRAGEWDVQRSIPFPLLAPLLDVGVECYQLQHLPRPEERHHQLRTLDADDPVSLARAMRGLDLVITIDSLSAHLAGALGVRVWTLLRKESDWRWMQARDDSPWYPTMRLFRQSDEGEWAEVLHKVRSALTRLSG